MRPQYIPNQYGATIVFRQDATEEEIAQAMNAIKHVLERVPAKWSDIVHKFDNRHGKPDFYIP